MEELNVINISRNTQGTGKAKNAGFQNKKNARTDNCSQKPNKRKRKKKRHGRYNGRHEGNGRWISFFLMLLGFLFILLFCFFLYQWITGGFGKTEQTVSQIKNTFQSERRKLIRANKTQKPEIEEYFLTPNPYSRPGEALEEVNHIFVHYTANPGTSAAQNRSYFENLGITGETSASAHFVIGYEGEIVQCIPLEEIGYAVKQRNYDSVSIECCYLSADGKFTEATYESLLRLCGWLLKEYKLTPGEVLRHYDEGGKKCPLYYVENEDEWEDFLEDLEQFILEEKI